MQQAGLHDGVSCTKVASEFCKLAAVGSIPTDSTILLLVEGRDGYLSGG